MCKKGIQSVVIENLNAALYNYTNIKECFGGISSIIP